MAPVNLSVREKREGSKDPPHARSRFRTNGRVRFSRFLTLAHASRWGALA